MLKEQTGPESPKRKNRRWYSDEDMDLIVWFDDNRKVTGFQLCYDKKTAEHALTWTEKDGFRLSQIDSGEHSPEENHAPILKPAANHHFPVQRITSELLRKGGQVESQFSEFVLNKLRLYPAGK